MKIYMLREAQKTEQTKSKDKIAWKSSSNSIASSSLDSLSRSMRSSSAILAWKATPINDYKSRWNNVYIIYIYGCSVVYHVKE